MVINEHRNNQIVWAFPVLLFLHINTGISQLLPVWMFSQWSESQTKVCVGRHKSWVTTKF